MRILNRWPFKRRPRCKCNPELHGMSTSEWEYVERSSQYVGCDMLLYTRFCEDARIRCKLCGRTHDRTGYYTSGRWEKVIHRLYPRDADGWPLDQDGSRLPANKPARPLSTPPAPTAS